jgi:copper chaperone CopZ
MIDTHLLIPALQTEDDASAVMFELQDLPCVHEAGVDLAARTARVLHTAMMSPQDIVAKLHDAGIAAELV